MSEPFLAEIKMFAGNFAIRGYALCNGQILPISQNTALFSLLGVTYGGNGTSNFALPNLQGRVPLHFGQGPGLSSYSLGQEDGTATVTLLSSEIPTHNHQVNALQSLDADGTTPAASYPAFGRNGSLYGTGNPLGNLAATTILPSGAGLPHNNMQPYLAVNFIIAMQGIFPARN